MARRPFPVRTSHPTHEPVDSCRHSSSPHHSNSSASPTHYYHSHPTNSSTTTTTTTTTTNQSQIVRSPSSSSSPSMPDDEVDTITSPPPQSSPPPLPSFSSSHTASFPLREDCWSGPATHTLVEAWGSRYLAFNRGNLRQKHWQEVADAVNALHAHTMKLHRTDIQCKNRIDTLKKKYKIEKFRVSESSGHYTSSWPFFSSLDAIIGNFFKSSPSAHRKTPPAPLFLPPLSAIPVGPRSKRRAAEDALFTRNFAAMTAAAALVEAEEDEEESETSTSSGAGSRMEVEVEVVEGYRWLAEAIEKFGEIYERVEFAKQRQMVELEKQRMQFTMDLEIQRMKFMESQVELEKHKRSKRTSLSDGCL